MDKRFLIFMVLSVAILVTSQVVNSLLFPPPPQQAGKAVKLAQAKTDKSKPAADKKGSPDKNAADKQTGNEKASDPKAGDKDVAEPKPEEAAAKEQAPPDDKNAPAEAAQWLTIGSADHDSPYRMLIVVTNRGAAVERLELNSPLYRDLEDFTGYLGYLAPANAPDKGGALVRMVGPGTPAAAAGLHDGDAITALDNHKIRSAADLTEALLLTVPRQTVQISITRQGAAQRLTAELGRAPLAVIRPEHDSKPVDVVRPGDHDPLSFLMTIQQFDERVLAADNRELGGVNLRTSEWKGTKTGPNAVTFTKQLPKLGLEVVKTYRLEKVPPDRADDANFPAYSFFLDVSIRNVGKQPDGPTHKVAYQLEGPTGLPIEGAWYANKVSRTWSGAGLRDVVARFQAGAITQITSPQLAAEDFDLRWTGTPLDYIAVDSQYFAAALIPQKENPADQWFAEVKPVRIGAVPKDKNNWKLTDVSFRMASTVAELAPGGKGIEHHFQIFAGPKKPALLAEYGPPGTKVSLSDLVYYGWFGVVAQPMLAILHAFHYVVGNYGLAIIMLTVLVRGCMFPLSRKQALSQKMQELQPEIKRLNEKFKSEPEKKTKAQQQLFREHNYNPLGGCLLAFVQLPIFVGLYRSLMVDVELRQAPLFSDTIRWASNLAAPDMLWNWSAFVPDFISHGTGFFALGPYLNILPLFTIALFIWQQKMFMPPPADEQAALQQKMMQYMMIFMGIMFFKVASGLCVYFIASSIWGIAERKLLPKKTPPSQSGPGGGSTAALPSTSGNGAAVKKRRQRGRK